MAKKKRPTYTAEFRQEAARRALQDDLPVSQVAQEIGVSETALRRWMEQVVADEGDGPTGLSAGAYAIWTMLQSSASTYAAAAPFAGGDKSGGTASAKGVPRLKDSPARPTTQAVHSARSHRPPDRSAATGTSTFFVRAMFLVNPGATFSFPCFRRTRRVHSARPLSSPGEPQMPA